MIAFAAADVAMILFASAPAISALALLVWAFRRDPTNSGKPPRE